MRRAVTALLSVFVVMVLFSAPAGALNDARVSGPVTGQAPFDFTTPRCSFVHQQYIVDVDSQHGPGAHLVVDLCIEGIIVNDTFPGSGTFTLTTPGGTLTGTAQGAVNASSSPFAFTLTATGGTQGFAHTTGTLSFTGNWASNMINGGPVTGTLTASLTK